MTRSGTFRRRPDEAPPARRGGFTLVEVALSTAVLVVAVLATLGSITASALLVESTRETTGATLGAQAMVEALRSVPLEEVFASFNDTPLDDPGGPGTAPGGGFVVGRLAPCAGDPDGLPGRIVLPVGARPDELREDHVDPGLGMPRDLNGDGTIDGAPHESDYRVLPVRVRVEWAGAGGARVVEVETVLGRS